MPRQRPGAPGQIVEHGFGEDDARGYAQAVSGGKTLVVAKAPDQKLDQAVAIIERHESAGAPSPEQGETVQQVEEELAVGKRKVATGGVRVTTSVSEQPVEETVTLREEKVGPRDSADRKLSPASRARVPGQDGRVLATIEEAAVARRPGWSASRGRQACDRAR